MKSGMRRALLALVILGTLLSAGTARAAGTISYKTVTQDDMPAYAAMRVSGLTPYVFSPTAGGPSAPESYTNVTGMMRRWGEQLDIAAAVNAGIFYCIGPETQFCFSYRQPDGVVIAGGVVLKSEESIDHSECDILVIDEDGHAGWADYWADADALAAGTGVFYDAWGEPVTGKRVVSAVTGFVPIVVGGESLYDARDLTCSGWDNYVGHYEAGAARQIIGVTEEGDWILLTNGVPWTLEDAARVAIAEGCVFAYNLDGGSSAETVTGRHDGDAYSIRTMRSQPGSGVPLPTYIVFPWDGEMPVSAVPLGLSVSLEGGFAPGVTLAEIAAAATVTETMRGANGDETWRRVYSAQGRGSEPIRHVIIGGSQDISLCEVKRESVSPAGTLYYVKDSADTDQSLLYNRNTRIDGAYYDYSTGFTVSTEDDLTTPGVKTLVFSYTPGYGLEPLTAEIQIDLQ